MHTVIIGGGLASGKTTAANYLGNIGATMVDLDYIARDVRSRPSIIKALVEQFGEQILAKSGAIDNYMLAEVAFSSPENTEALNAIIHPAIAKTANDTIRNYGSFAAKGIFLMQVPLVEKAQDLCAQADEVLVISAPAELRLKRAIERGMFPADAQARIANQASDEELEALADTVIENTGTVDELIVKLDAWYEDRMSKQ